MRRTRFVLLALVAAFVVGLLGAGTASAATVVIDAMDDSPGSRWVPPSVTIDAEDTVRWEFDAAQTSHTVNSSSTNWSQDSGSKSPGSAPVEVTFDEPGVYTFLCQIHPGTMTGSVTVEAADQLENVLVFSKTAGFRHDSIPQGIAAIEQLGADNDFNVDASEDSTVFSDANLAQYDAVVFLSTTGDILNNDQQAAFERYIQAGGGYVGIHAAADTEYTWPWYGEMLGGYFRNHPPGTPTASVDIEDGDEPSTTGLPTRWTRTDEWYNFQGPVNPVVNGGGNDYSPRDSDVKVLATVDESTYDEQDGNTTDDDHPVAWCSQFDGGRVWYTAMGHTQASFNTAEGNLRSHILGGIRTAAGDGPSDCGDPREASPSPSDFEKVTLDDDTSNPMELDIAADGRVFYIERDGRVMIWKPDTGTTVQAGSVPVTLSQENGLLGIQLAPNFATSGHIYLAYSALPDSSNQNRVSRFTVQGDAIVAGSEQIIYTWQHQRAQCCHTSGSLAFAPDGSLYISTGDNTNPFDSNGMSPIDERPGREAWDAQRSSANTNSPNGKILHINPLPTASGTPGVGTTYTIPANNLFPVGTAQTLPEIYAMGFRNPFRITVDPKTGWVLMGDYGPDAGATDPNRGPQGSVEYNVVPTAGNYGWPYCVRQNVPYNDYDFATGTSGPTFNCAAPVNNSPNNTGLTNLPPARPATMWMGYTETDARFPALGGGGAPTGGPRYDYDANNPSDTKFPAFYDGQWFVGEWNNGWIKTATLNGQGEATSAACFVSCTAFPGDGYLRPMDIEFGPDGSLYVIEWGSGFGGNNADSGIYRIDYLKGERKPIAHATATPDSGPVPLEVEFSSEGSIDPEGTSLTYAWDFDGDGDTDSTQPNPTHTYTTAGNFSAKLTVTDQAGDEGIDNVTIVAGNTRPEVTIEVPENGKVADFGDIVPFEVSVTDAEDGSTAAGTIDCDAITVNISLGHDEHAHELSDQTGCEGTFEIEGVSGHGANANTFTVVEAVYTDEGAGAAGPVTGRDEAILQPKQKQAEFWDTTGRTADSHGTGDPGIVNEATTDTGGGSSAAFVEDGDWISFNPYNLEDLDSVTFRVASAGSGGIIELRYDAADGPLVAATPNIPPTGGWQTWTDVNLDLPETVPAGTHRLFVVFRHPTATGSLMNLNWFRFNGKGAAVTAPPEVSATADPASGEAPLEVAFDATATDPEGEALTYAWDFGVPGTSDDTSTEQDPTYTYARAGNYTATVTARDASGGDASATVEVRVTNPPSECPTGPVRSDEFDGNALDTDRWTVLRPDAANPFSVEGGQLNLPIANGSMYGPGTTAKNIIVQPTPDGAWTATAKVTAESLTENYHQAGLRVWSDDDNWASVHMIHAGGNRDFEFIYENDGVPRNEGPDKLGGIPADAPTTYYVRITSDGTDLTASYSYDGNTFLPVGRPAPLSAFDAPQIGPAALSDLAPSVPMSTFDWIRFDPDGTGGGSGGIVDDFDGSALGGPWSVVRQNQNLVVGGGTLQIPAAPGDIYGGRNDAQNLVVRDAPDGSWEAITKLNFEGTAQYHQAGIMVYGDDANFTKFGRIAHSGAGDEKFEFIYENAGTPRNEAADSTGNIPADFPDDFYLRLTSDGTNVTGAYSTNGTAWTPVGRAAPLPAGAKLGMFAFSNDGTGNPVAAFDSFSLTGENVGGGGGGGGGPAGPSRDDQFDGSSLDKSRWNAIERDTPAEYAVAGGKLTITTGPGDIYTGDTNPPPNNFILQSADHAGADWVIETKIDGATINGGYGQGGLMAYSDGSNYVKFDAISDAGNTRINRLELRSEIAGAIQQPQPADPPIAEGVTEIWLRLTKTGQSYAGEYSLDGETWTPVSAPVTNPMETPDFGLFAFGPQADGQGDIVPFEYFTLDGEDTGECECESTGDEFDGASLDKTKWNGIVREDDTKYVVEGGALKVTTVGGDIYSGPDTAVNTRNFLLQTPDHAGADWVIETKVGGAQLSGGYEHAGLLAYEDDGDYVKYDLISDDGQSAVNRIELRSEENDVIQEPQPQFNTLPAGTTEAWLRLTKTGDVYKGEYSFDGQTWTALAATVQNDMAAPRFGLFTQGVNSPGGTVTFDYFSIDGERGCGEEPPTNTPPVLGEVTASPTSGFAPLPVDFTSDATDADEDELTYSWDFDGDGTADANTKNASHTYAQAGVYNAKVTVSDGEASVSKTVQVTVLPADDPEARFRTLVFSKTTGFRHDSIPQGIAAIQALGEANDFQVDATEDSTVFRDAVLAKYDTVVFLSTTGDPLNNAQQEAFERYVKGGGGYTGIHAAADTEYEWNWYGKLVGGYFLSHPPGTPDATVNIEDTDHHSTTGIPTPWDRTDEWYNYKSPDFADPNVPDGDYSPRAGGVHVLATVDEATYDEQDGNTTDDDHPISWCQRYDGGRSWYTGMGHTQASFSEPDFRKHILGGLEVTAGVVADADCGEESGIQVQAFADPSSGPAPLTVNFSATGLDPDGDELTYKWTFPDGSAFGSSVTRTLRTPGPFTATVTVTDADGNSASDEVSVMVGEAESEPPVIVEAGADDPEGPAPHDVLFHAVAEDPEGGDLTYKWDFGDGGSAFGDEAEHSYLTPGSFTARVTVTDETGQTATQTIAITVTNPPGNRAPSVEGAAAPASGKAPLEVLFTAQGTDPDGDTLTYSWDFGDDSDPVSGKTARHVFAKNGVFTATVTATDRAGLSGTDEVTITVGNPAGGQNPTVEVAADRTSGAAPLKVNFSAAGSDPDGDSITYVWDFGDGGQAGGTQVTHTYTTPGAYEAKVTVTDVGGKTGTATVTITVSAARQAVADQPVAPTSVKGALRALSTPSLGSFRTRGLKVSATCEATGKAAVGLWASKTAARKLGLKSRGLGRAQFDCTAGKTLQLTLKPTRKVRKAIKAARPKSLKITVALALEDGAAITRTLTLKR